MSDSIPLLAGSPLEIWMALDMAAAESDRMASIADRPGHELLPQNIW